jgi:hypothetical protein
MLFATVANTAIRFGKRVLLFESFRGGWISCRSLATTSKNPNENAQLRQRNAGKRRLKTPTAKPVF